MPSALSDRVFVMAEAGLAGKILETFLFRIVNGDDGLSGPVSDHVYGLIDTAVSRVAPGCDGVMFLPWLEGSMAPKLNGRQRGAFVGMSLDTTRAHLLRSVLEGIALQMRWLIDEVEHVLGVRYPTVRFAGGGAASDAWAQTLADVLGRGVDQVGDPRLANARGAGLLGLMSIGAIGLGELANAVPIRKTFSPTAEWQGMFEDRITIYRDLHDRLAEPVAQLASANGNV
jgi:xylulokinase